MKRTLHVILALLLAGSAFFLGGWAARIRRGVTVEGISVGGMTYAEARTSVRAQLDRIPLIVHTPTGDVTPRVVYEDDLDSILRHAKRGGSYAVTVRRELPDAEEFLADVCAENVLAPQDAHMPGLSAEKDVNVRKIVFKIQVDA